MRLRGRATRCRCHGQPRGATGSRSANSVRERERGASRRSVRGVIGTSGSWCVAGQFGTVRPGCHSWWTGGSPNCRWPACPTRGRFRASVAAAAALDRRAVEAPATPRSRPSADVHRPAGAGRGGGGIGQLLHRRHRQRHRPERRVHRPAGPRRPRPRSPSVPDPARLDVHAPDDRAALRVGPGEHGWRPDPPALPALPPGRGRSCRAGPGAGDRHRGHRGRDLPRPGARHPARSGNRPAPARGRRA